MLCRRARSTYIKAVLLTGSAADTDRPDPALCAGVVHVRQRPSGDEAAVGPGPSAQKQPIRNPGHWLDPLFKAAKAVSRVERRVSRVERVEEHRDAERDGS